MVVWVLDHWQWDQDALFQVAKSTSDREVLRRLAAAGLEHSPDTLFSAALNGNMALLTAALDAGVPPDSGVSMKSLPGYSDKMYALAIACESGHLSCAWALLMAGADVDRQGRNGSALSEAARVGQLECMRLLLKCNADVHARDWAGRTALMEATSARQIECVRLLLENEADVHARSDGGRTALNFSKGDFDMSYHKRDQTACTRLLLDAGADVNDADNDSYTALMHAALYGNRSLSPLLEAGADVFAANANGFTLMLSACRSGYMENVLLLDGLGADSRAVRVWRSIESYPCEWVRAQRAPRHTQPASTEFFYLWDDSCRSRARPRPQSDPGATRAASAASNSPVESQARTVAAACVELAAPWTPLRPLRALSSPRPGLRCGRCVC